MSTEGRREGGREREKRERYYSIYNPCVLSLAVTPGKFSSTAELLCCFDLMNIHDQAEGERGRGSGSWQHVDVLLLRLT